MKCPCSLTFSLHTHGQALLVAAVLAPVPLSLVHHTVLVVPTGVGQVFAHCSLEEAFTALAAVDAIMLTWSTWKGRRERAEHVRHLVSEAGFFERISGRLNCKLSCKGGVSSPEDLSPQMEQRRFWESIGPGLWDESCFKPSGGFTSSELLTAWSPDMDTVELI